MYNTVHLCFNLYPKKLKEKYPRKKSNLQACYFTLLLIEDPLKEADLASLVWQFENGGVQILATISISIIEKISI